MDNKSKIFESWPTPEFTPRTNQIIALEWLEKQTAKYLILEAPVGSGKSHTALTFATSIASQLKSSFVLTPQIILQKQYAADFKENGNSFLASLHGKSNYKCIDKKASCNVGSKVKPKCAACPYIKAKQRALYANNTVLNYKLALTTFTYTDTFARRKLLIMDEAHTLERHLVDFDSVDIKAFICEKYNIKFKVNTNIKLANEWVTKEYLPKIQNALNTLEEDSEYLYEKTGTEITRKELKLLSEIDELSSHVNDVLELSIRNVEYLETHFVLVHDKTMIQFKRITGAYSFKKIFEPQAKRFLFMSSTILNKKQFCADLGIDEKDTAFLSLASDFPVENRPIYYMPILKMNASWNKPEQENGRKQMVTRIGEILDIHKTESGIIHTANYQIAIWLVQELSKLNSHDIYHHNPNTDHNRNTAIDMFIESTVPSILISPSCTEGLDLKDELARFAMIVKTPFGYLGDQWIKKRLDMSPEWYRRRAMTDIIQAGGRIVRSATDNGTVYILDGSFGYLYSQSSSMIPKWWKDSLVFV